MAETGRDGGTGTSVAWTACAAEDAAEAGPRGEVAASTHPAPSPPTLLTTLPKIAVLSASGGLVDSSSLVGVGMIGLHPMFQLAWGPFSAHLGPNRAAQLQRYRYKRMLRLQAISRGERKIRYQCRKQLADARPRVKGRFVKTCAGDVYVRFSVSVGRRLYFFLVYKLAKDRRELEASSQSYLPLGARHLKSCISWISSW